MLTITRKLEFDYGHRVLGHEGKCRHIHGHRGVVELTVTAAALDTVGRVIDFSVIKREVGGWLDDSLDHNFLAHPEDPLLTLAEDTETFYGVFAGKHPFVMPYGNPTAENIARVIYEKAVCLLQPHGIRVTGVRLYETPNSWADYDGNGYCDRAITLTATDAVSE